MALAMIQTDFGIARDVAHRAEYVWNSDSENDLFAVAAKL